jgi:hypothetical protein
MTFESLYEVLVNHGTGWMAQRSPGVNTEKWCHFPLSFLLLFSAYFSCYPKIIKYLSVGNFCFNFDLTDLNNFSVNVPEPPIAITQSRVMYYLTPLPLGQYHTTLFPCSIPHPEQPPPPPPSNSSTNAPPQHRCCHLLPFHPLIVPPLNGIISFELHE